MELGDQLDVLRAGADRRPRFAWCGHEKLSSFRREIMKQRWLRQRFDGKGPWLAGWFDWSGSSTGRRLVTGIVWLVAIGNLGRTVVSLWHYPELGFDLRIVHDATRAFARGLSPYSVRGFVYPPSSALLFRPIASVPLDVLLYLGLLVTALTLVSLVILSTSAVDLSTALMLAFATLAAPVRSVLALENFSALMAVALAVFVLLGVRERWIAAGAVLGLSLAIKPMLAPALLVLMLERRWRALTVAVGIPTALTALAVLAMSDPNRFLSETLPFLSAGAGRGYDAYNAAILPVFRQLGWSPLLALAVRLAVVAAVVIVVVLVERRERPAGPSGATVTGILMVGALLVGPLSEDHFVLALAPLLASARCPRAYLRPWVAVGALVLMGAYVTERLPQLNTLPLYARQRCAGMLVLVVAIMVEVLRRDLLAGNHSVRNGTPCDEGATFAAPK